MKTGIKRGERGGVATRRKQVDPMHPTEPSKKTRQKPTQKILTRREFWVDRARALATAISSTPPLSVEVSLALKSEANQRGHWAPKAARVSSQRDAVALALMQWPARGDVLRLRQALADGRTVVVGLTIRRPRCYDDDNRAGATKAVRDELAKALAIDDGSARLMFLPVAHEKSSGSSVLIEVWVLNASGTEARTGEASDDGARELVEPAARPTPVIAVPEVWRSETVGRAARAEVGDA